jgi:hypothetical protein
VTLSRFYGRFALLIRQLINRLADKLCSHYPSIEKLGLK